MVEINIYEVCFFIFHGFLGGLLWLFTHWVWTRKMIVQHTLVSAIAGYVYWYLHSEYNFPNGFMAIVSGYFSADFIEHVLGFFGRKMNSKSHKH